VTGNRRPAAEQLVASDKGAQEATSHLEQGGDSCHPARRLEHSAGTGSSDVNNTATNLEEAVQFAQCMRDDSVKDFPDPTTDGPLMTRVEFQPPQGGVLEASRGSTPRRTCAPLPT
jgi:hypothetical protein